MKKIVIYIIIIAAAILLSMLVPKTLANVTTATSPEEPEATEVESVALPD